LSGALLALFFSGQTWTAYLRWAGLIAVASTGLWRQSLTRWIFFAMVLGGEIGLDRPQFAEHLRVLSEIFLWLIKAIVAPLIFGTLVTGISGHGNLRSAGRIGLKSLIYFEVVTTLALL
jgi:proton glutamate symport protein